MTAWEFFDRRVCLSNDEGEWQKAQTEFSRVGLDCERFPAVPIDGNFIKGPHQSFSQSERTILSEFYESGTQRLLHLEDDCVFLESQHLEDALRELPYNWDIIYLGCNVRDPSPRRFSRHLYRVQDAWMTHAIGYNRKVIPFLLENQPDINEQMFDNWVGSQLCGLNAYVISPMVAWQRARYSSIWDRPVDYADVLVESQNKLR